MKLIERYLEYVRNVKRYSERTFAIYRDVLKSYVSYVSKVGDTICDAELLESLNRSEIRQYEVYLLDEKKCKASTVNQHLSVLSGFCQFLIKRGDIKANPVKLVARPKMEKRLPEFFRQDAMEGYFKETEENISVRDLELFMAYPQLGTAKKSYEKRLSRLIISLLYSLGLRRSELVGLRICDIDFARKVVNVVGKGNKSRAIPMDDVLADEILLYLKAVEALVEGDRTASEPLLITYSGRELYPVYVDRVVKKELGDSTAFAGRKSPHVLRHSIATGLLNEGAELNSIKEMLGHSSLAATQVYTHNSIAKLQKVYKDAHPRAKRKTD